MNVFEECIKCQNDFSYFAGTYLKVNHPKRGLVPFPLYDFQKRLVLTYDENRFVVVIKFRQGGFSTLTTLYALWQCMFHNDRHFLFISKTDREAICLGKIVDLAIRNLPEEFRPFLSHSNDHHKTFKCTNSEMWFLPPTAACSKSFTHLVIDEAAFIPQMEDHWQAMYPRLGDNGKCFVVSTVNGIGNWYEEIYRGAGTSNNFHAFDCSYTEHPEYNNAAWVEQMKKNLGERGWMQEMECCFVGSTPTKQDILRNTLRKIVDNPHSSEKDMIKNIQCKIYEALESD
jgi:hypothetical protein